jgi:hypothetical protein
VYARLCPVYGWTEVDPITGVVGPFILKDVHRAYGMINGVTTRGIHTGRPLIEFDAVSVDGNTWLPLKENISLIPQETANVRQSVEQLMLGP